MKYFPDVTVSDAWFLPVANVVACMTSPVLHPCILSQFPSLGYRLEVGGQLGQEHKAVPQGSLGLSSHKTRAKATWLLAVPRSLRQNRKQRGSFLRPRRFWLKHFSGFSQPVAWGQHTDLSLLVLAKSRWSGRVLALRRPGLTPDFTVVLIFLAPFQLSEIILVQLWRFHIRMNRRVVTG